MLDVYYDDGTPRRLDGVSTDEAINLYGVTHYSPVTRKFYGKDSEGKLWELDGDEGKLRPVRTDLTVIALSTQESEDFSLYNAYQIDVSDVDIIDVYEIHNRYKIDDPSGAIQHASKKLLLAGTRTGNKPKYKDIKEARDTLNRWLEMNDGS